MFMSVFRRLFIYNIVFEDGEVDQSILGLDGESEVISITGAGCGVAGMAHKRIHRLDAVDINHHHLALAALKLQGAQKLEAYSDFYDLFARGYATDPGTMVRKLTEGLPPWIQKYWKHHHRRFHRPYFRQSMSGHLFWMLRKLADLSADWLRKTIPMSLEERCQFIDETVGPALRRPFAKALMKTPFHDLSMGINKNQRDRALEATNYDDLVSYYIFQMKRVAETDIERNWIAWYTVAGHFNHDNPDSLPPYLRRGMHERSVGGDMPVRYHNDNLINVMRRAGSNTWSHYIVSDAPDWMPETVQRQMLEEIARTAKPGAVVLRRTVENDCLMEKHGMTRRFERLDDPSDWATRTECSRNFQRVDLYRLVS